jgi:hypothetical protein
VRISWGGVGCMGGEDPSTYWPALPAPLPPSPVYYGTFWLRLAEWRRTAPSQARRAAGAGQPARRMAGDRPAQRRPARVR